MLQKLFNKLVSAFIYMMSFMWILTFALLLAQSKSDVHFKGCGMNGFLAFGLWVVFMFIMISGHPIVADVLSVAVYAFLYVKSFGVDGPVLDAIAVLIMGYILWKMFFSFIENFGKEDEGGKGGGSTDVGNHWQSGDDEEWADEQRHRGTPVAGGSCPHLRQLDSGYYKGWACYKCDVCGREFEEGFCRKRCFYADYYRKCHFYSEC